MHQHPYSSPDSPVKVILHDMCGVFHIPQNLKKPGNLKVTEKKQNRLPVTLKANEADC